jgi:hypothetical protein
LECNLKKILQVGPYSNRQETYNYYSLPFCRGEKKKIEHYHETIGEALLGVELEFSGMNIRYKIDQPKNTFCKKTLTPDEADAFIFAVEHNYWWAKILKNIFTIKQILGIKCTLMNCRYGVKSYSKIFLKYFKIIFSSGGRKRDWFFVHLYTQKV